MWIPITKLVGWGERSEPQRDWGIYWGSAVTSPRSTADSGEAGPVFRPMAVQHSGDVRPVD